MLAGVNEQVGQRIAVRVAYTWKGCRRDDGRKERCWSNRNSTATNDTTAAAFLLVELFFVFRSGSGGSVAHWFRFSLLTSTTLRSLPLVVVLATALEYDGPSTSSSSSPGQEDPTVGNSNTTRLRFTKLLNAFCCCCIEKREKINFHHGAFDERTTNIPKQDKVVAVLSPPTKGRVRRGRREILPFGEYSSIHADPSFDRRILEVTAKEEKKNKIDTIYTQNKSLVSKISLLSIAADVLDDVTRRFCVVEGPHGGKKVQQQQQKRKYNKIEGRKRGEGGVFFFIIIIIFNATQESATAGILLFVVCMCV